MCKTNLLVQIRRRRTYTQLKQSVYKYLNLLYRSFEQRRPGGFWLTDIICVPYLKACCTFYPVLSEAAEQYIVVYGSQRLSSATTRCSFRKPVFLPANAGGWPKRSTLRSCGRKLFAGKLCLFPTTTTHDARHSKAPEPPAEILCRGFPHRPLAISRELRNRLALLARGSHGTPDRIR